MVYRQVVITYKENYMKRINSLYGQNAKFVKFTSDGTCTYLLGLKKNVRCEIRARSFTNTKQLHTHCTPHSGDFWNGMKVSYVWQKFEF